MDALDTLEADGLFDQGEGEGGGGGVQPVADLAALVRGRLSPLKQRNLNVLGRYSFTATQPAGAALRPLRDPDAARTG